MGLGHILPIKALAQHFVDDGHIVYVVLQDLKHAQSVFSDMHVHLLQAPHRHGTRNESPTPAHCYAQLLAINGFANDNELLGLARAWQTLFTLIAPDILLIDHSPSALIAARGLDCIKVNIGTGFTIPPAQTPLAIFSPDKLNNQQQQSVIDDEEQLLQRCNRVLTALQKPTMTQLSDLYSDARHNAFLSLPEFDHFTARADTHYLGVAQHDAANKQPQWPAVTGKKIFIYLKPFQALNALLQQLQNTDASIIFYSNDIPAQQLAPFQAQHICFEREPLDLNSVAAQADFVIINANHSTLMHFVLNQVAVMMLPLHWEQQLMAIRMQEQGIGVLASHDDAAQTASCIRRMLQINGCSDAVKALAEKYKDIDASQRQKTFCQTLIQQLS